MTTYDPYEGILEVRCLQDGRYVLHSANEQGRFWIPQLELYLGIWSGERLAQTMNWLRWWDNSGNLLLWSSEQAQQESQRAELERQRADQETQRAEQESQRADQETQRADQETQRAQRLAAKLRELGVDPD